MLQPSFETPTPAPRTVRPTDVLVLPMHKSLVTQYGRTETGAPELRLYYDRLQVAFDEPDLFAFGEALGRQLQFVAGETLSWAEGLDWTRARDILDQLVDAGILRFADEDFTGRPLKAQPGERPSPLPPAPAAEARDWTDCEAVMRDLTGRPLELGHLELVVPIFRVAHVAVDADGRQVGEANVFPKALRVEVPTKWQACLFSGTRHQTEKPMNVTALKAMREHWPAMMTILLRVREHYLQRFPEARSGWTVGHLERLATSVLALTSYPLMRADAPVASGALHPALSSVFRVTDGLRMTLHEMLFVPLGEPTVSPDTPITAAEVHAYAERNYSFHSPHGVCAGPEMMVKAFLATIIDGEPVETPVSLDPAVVEALDALDAAFAYGMLALQAHAAVFVIWPDMVRTYERLQAITEAWPEGGVTGDLKERLRNHLRHIRLSTYVGDEARRAEREAVYADMYRQAGFGAWGVAPGQGLLEALDARPDETGPVAAELNGLLQTRAGGADAGSIAAAARALAAFLVRLQAMLRLAGDRQRQVNDALGRAQPRTLFSSRDLDLHNALQGQEARRLPYLLDELRDALGLDITVDATAITIVDAWSAA